MPQLTDLIKGRLTDFRNMIFEGEVRVENDSKVASIHTKSDRHVTKTYRIIDYFRTLLGCANQ